MNTQIASAAPAITNLRDQSEAAVDREDHVSRRRFCNRLLVTSSGLLVGASALMSVAAHR